ncbi:hypothetical protein FQN49_003944 [Arthroderma sp. PD_2]|nr:hypothetical protein FQN49_003944 [Arthroderma sp. PD_2]
MHSTFYKLGITLASLFTVSALPAQGITIDLFHSNTTCISNSSGDVTFNSVKAGSGCQRINLPPNKKYKAAGAFSAKVVATNPGVVLHLFDDTACTDTTPDTVKGDGSTGCAASAVSGAGWMSFKVDSV